MTSFALLGAGGYVAPRHLKAIHEVSGTLEAACDPSDSVGILDRYFPEARFFTEVERFDRFLEKRLITQQPLDYVSVCTPNHLHDAHIRLALRVGADAICEKPLVLNPWNLDQLSALEKRYGKKVHVVLQLRLLPQLLELKQEVESTDCKYAVDLDYITPRGPWYHTSWKGDESRSGGLATNIGIHLLDMLIWVFGDYKRVTVNAYKPDRIHGFLELERATVWFTLSTRRRDLPSQEFSSHRSMVVDGRKIDFSTGFTDLHTRVYENILAGNGLGVEDARPAIELAYDIRSDPGVRK